MASSSRTAWKVDRKDPLLIPEILDLIFGFLKIPEQRIFRLVSKLWMRSTLFKWRKTTKLVVDDMGRGCRANRKFVNFIHQLIREDDHQLDFPLLDVHPLQTVAIINANLKLFENSDDNNGFKTLLNVLLQGQRSLPTMMFQHCELQCANFGEGIKWLLTENLTNLNRLSICRCYVDEVEVQVVPSDDAGADAGANKKEVCGDGGGVPVHATCLLREFNFSYIGGKDDDDYRISSIHFANIFKCTPHLKDLNIDGKAMSEEVLRGLLTVCRTMNDDPPILLERLKLNCRKDGFQILLDLAPYLRNLRVFDLHDSRVGDFRAPPFVIRELFKCFAGSIERLEWDIMDFTPTTNHPFLNDFSSLKFINLTTLRIFTNKRDLRFDFNSFRHMEALQKLELVTVPHAFSKRLQGDPLKVEEMMYVGSHEKWMNGYGDVPTGKFQLKKLTYFFYNTDQPLSMEALTYLGGMMPNLEDLHILFYNKTFAMKREIFPKLRRCGILRGSVVRQRLLDNEELPLIYIYHHSYGQKP